MGGAGVSEQQEDESEQLEKPEGANSVLASKEVEAPLLGQIDNQGERIIEEGLEDIINASGGGEKGEGKGENQTSEATEDKNTDIPDGTHDSQKYDGGPSRANPYIEPVD
jgi:hypothetical protein